MCDTSWKKIWQIYIRRSACSLSVSLISHPSFFFSRLYFRVFAFLQLTRVDVAAPILSPFTRLDDRKDDGPGERTSARKKETNEEHKDGKGGDIQYRVGEAT